MEFAERVIKVSIEVPAAAPGFIQHMHLNLVVQRPDLAYLMLNFEVRVAEYYIELPLTGQDLFLLSRSNQGFTLEPDLASAQRCTRPYWLRIPALLNLIRQLRHHNFQLLHHWLNSSLSLLCLFHEIPNISIRSVGHNEAKYKFIIYTKIISN